MYTYPYERLDVWKEAKDLAVEIYKTTGKYPKEELYGLVSQMRRSAISIPSNIAEGTSRNTAKDKSHFMTLSYGSTMELLNQLIISNELDFITEEDYLSHRKRIESITNKSKALRNHFLKE